MTHPTAGRAFSYASSAGSLTRSTRSSDVRGDAMTICIPSVWAGLVILAVALTALWILIRDWWMYRR